MRELALEAGALELGEDGPDGAHFIFSVAELERFAELVRSEGERVAPPCPPLPY